jgi:pyruvate dehydrogenase complex dihydrolipoamide acetyltransferase long form
MVLEIKIPKLGLTMTEATLVSWAVAAGEPVIKEQIVCAIETDKVAFEVPSPGEGLLHPTVDPGRTVAVGEVIGYIAGNEAELKDLQSRQAAVQAEPKPAQTPPELIQAEKVAAPPKEAAPQPKKAATLPKEAAAPPKEPFEHERVLVSPAARKLSKSLGLELREITGSGDGGRIVLADVEKATENKETAQAEKRFDFGSMVKETESLSVAEKIAIRGIRKIIFQNMRLSLITQAQLTLHTEASAQGLRDTRSLLNAQLKDEQTKVSYNALIVKAAAQALRQYPRLNAVVDGREIKIWEQIHIGVAVDFGQGLIVPKIRNADTKSISVIAAELSDLATRAENKSLLPDELQGGTFTISNLGNWDIDYFTPIANFPESAILGVGRVVDKPWVRGGEVVAEPRIGLSLTFDHRIIDGALAAEFLKSLKSRIEETRLML